MTIVADYSESWDDENNTDEYGYPFEAGRIFQLVLCPACNDVNLLRTDWEEHDDPEFPLPPPEFRDADAPREIQLNVLYPPPDRLTNLPPEIAKEYRAALRVKSIDSNAFAVLLGRMIDRLLADLGARKGTMNNRVQNLANQGVIPPKLAEMIDQMRRLRNFGAHAETVELTDLDTVILHDLGRIVLDYLYTAPRLLEQVERRTKKSEE